MSRYRAQLLRTLCIMPAITLSLASPAAAQPADVPQVTEPVWAKPDHFWFRRTIGGTNVWLNVNALHGVKEPLFDHQRLAIELTIRTGRQFEPATLPFADPALQFVVKYDGANAYIQQGAMAIEFIYNNNLWRCDLQIKWDWNRVPPTDYECLSRRPAPPTSIVPPPVTARRSPDGRWEAFVQNHNIAIRPVDNPGNVTVLTTDGTPTAAYQAGSIVWSADSRSLTAYRVDQAVWLSETINANVKRYIHRGEWRIEVGRLEEIGGDWRRLEELGDGLTTEEGEGTEEQRV